MSKRKKPVEFKADNIDNTESVKKILEELRQKNSQAHTFYCHNIKQRRTTKNTLHNCHFITPGHPLNAFSDDWYGDFNVDYFEPFPYKSIPPKIITELENIGINDPVTNIMKLKLKWQNKLHCLKWSAHWSKMKDKYEELNDEVVKCPKHLIYMAAHMDSDPDPYFDSSHNWYYSGNGNFQLICLEWTDYLLFSVLNCVYLSEFNKTDIIINKEAAAVFACDKENNILETICTSQNITVLRTKNKVYILKIIISNDKIEFEKLEVIQSEIPYTSISCDSFHQNILYITTLENKLSIINLDRMKMRSVKLKGKLTSLTNNWNSVIGSDRQYYTHATKGSITLYDKRSNNVNYVWSSVRSITDEIGCNDISVAKHFNDSSLYFGTDHHLFLMDIRYQNNKPRVVQRWTHGMESVPTYISFCSMEFSKSMICLSSQWCEDMCVISNYSDRFIKDTNSGGMSMPYRPPSILGALNDAQQKMLCFDLYNPIDSRLCTAITGNLIIEQGDKYVILIQNSLGDVTCHTLFPEYLESFIEDDSATSLHDWSLHYKQQNKLFEVSSIKNIANALKQLKKVGHDYKIEESWVKTNTMFDENEISAAFENEIIDSGLQDVWSKEATNETIADQSSHVLNLYYSEDEE